VITALGLSAALDITYLVDQVHAGEIHRPHEVLALPGGKALNVVRAVRVLRGEVRAIVPTGGYTGARVRDGLVALGVDGPEINAGEETRLCITMFGDDGADPTEFYERAPEIPDAAWAAVRGAVDAMDDGWLAVSGSVPDGRIADLVETLAAAAARGIRIALDTHGKALAEVLHVTPPEVVKINRHEAAQLRGAGEAAALARGLGDRGVGLAVVTDGPDGSVAVQGGEAWRASPPRAGRFAVGSGDSFLAGLLVGLDRGSELPETLRLATAAAAANTLAPGAALFDLEDVTRIAPAVEVRSLSEAAGGAG